MTQFSSLGIVVLIPGCTAEKPLGERKVGNPHTVVFNLAWSLDTPDCGPETEPRSFPPADSFAKWTMLKTKQGVFSPEAWQP